MATLHMIAETSLFMMSFVIVTDTGNCIIVDGGRPEDMPSLKETVAGRHVSAWILTHPHNDHISGFVSEMEKNVCADFDLESVWYRFPDYDTRLDEFDVPDARYFREEALEMLPAFRAVRDRFAGKEHVVTQGETLDVDEVHIEFLYTWHDGLYGNPMNDSSLVFRVSTPNTSVLFLGDLGPEGGDLLFYESRDKLPSDIVQMAHHGHMNVSMEVYAAIRPKACLWCARDWLYGESDKSVYGNADSMDLFRRRRIRMYGTGLTRQWMDLLGVKKHYVTADGTQVIPL